MKKFHTYSMATVLVTSLLVGLGGPISAFAASTPSLGLAVSYGVLASTYTNTTATTINADVGFTTGPAVVPTGTHTNYGPTAPYANAGSNQGTALSSLNSQACTFTFAAGAINLSTDVTHGSAGVYTPGVYCVLGAMAVAGPLSFNGSGTYIFRSTGALTSAAGAAVALGGASACDVFWTPTEATTLAANTTFMGTIIDDAGITVGANSTWTGRALAFGGTVTTDTDIITGPTCAVAPVVPAPVVPATLHVIKQVVNNNGGVATASLFSLHVKLSGADVAGSPAAGMVTPGTSYSLSAGTYVVSENANASYVQSFSGDCDVNGSVTLVSGDNKTCTMTNTDIPVVVVPIVPIVPVVPVVVTPPVVTPVTPVVTLPVTPIVKPVPPTVKPPTTPVTLLTTTTSDDIVIPVPVPVKIPGFPDTGLSPDEQGAPWGVAIPAGIFAMLALIYVVRKKLIT